MTATSKQQLVGGLIAASIFGSMFGGMVSALTDGQSQRTHAASSDHSQQVRTVVKYKIKTVTVHDKVPVPLPLACSQVSTQLAGIEKAASILTRTTGQHLDNMNAAVSAIVQGDQSLLVRLSNTEYKLKNESDPAATGLYSLVDSFRATLKECRNR